MLEADSASVPSKLLRPGVTLAQRNAPKPRLLDPRGELLRSCRYSRRIEQSDCHWVKRWPRMPSKFVLFLILFLAGSPNILHPVEPSSDIPEYARDPTALFKAADTYEQALQVWKTPGDIHAWIAANFSYDVTRAMRLSETQRKKNGRLSIYTPSEFFTTKAGVCVDLSRFVVETLRSIDPQSDPKYLMIAFDPIQINANTLRLHWLVRFKRNGKIYFFADSKRPSHIAGPYNETREFIHDYEQYRGRKIVDFREVDSYQKQRRKQALKLQAPAKP